MQKARLDRDYMTSSEVTTTLTSYKYALRELLKGRVIAIIHFIVSISYTHKAFNIDFGSARGQTQPY
jgi:hypothetical protein